MLQFPHKMLAYVCTFNVLRTIYGKTFKELWLQPSFTVIGCYVSRKQIFHVYVYTLENIHGWLKPTKLSAFPLNCFADLLSHDLQHTVIYICLHYSQPTNLKIRTDFDNFIFTPYNFELYFV